MDFDQRGLFTRADALASGFTDDDLRRARARRTIVAVRRGWFVRGDVLATLNSAQQHALLAQATYTDSGDDVVLSHVSAAVVLGLDVWNLPLDTVTMTSSRGHSGKRSRRRFLHGTELLDDEWLHLDDMRVTRPSRTVVDVARTHPLDVAVCVGDQALRHGLTTIEELAKSCDAAQHRTGAGRARRAVSAMSTRSDSVGESRSRLILQTVSTPLCNQTVFDDSGRRVARTDFLFPDLAEVIAEFDGEEKYGSQPRKAIIAEKNRHNRLAEQGRTVFRFDWRDLSTPQVIIDRLHAAYRRAVVLGPPSGRYAELPLPPATALMGICAPYRRCGFPRGA
ncbi:hypothetical protein ACIGGF_12960 [Rhodococcus sp. NPDC078407]|uniref:hypothetical protein n=1 Tax=Rhodococcus sp. NPDC078407 TaxID=3364509 RepID=UPI0037C544BF